MAETTTESCLRDLIITAAGPEILSCYQCRKCSAGCPLAFAMDLLPHQVIRAVLLDRRQRVLSSRTIWICASCETCTTRCPNDVDVAGVMDALRQIQLQSDERAGDRRIPVFHRVFLDCIKKRGRVHELSLLRNYLLRSGSIKEKLKSGAWKSDARLGIKLFLRGKLKITAPRCKKAAEVRSLFSRPGERQKV